MNHHKNMTVGMLKSLFLRSLFTLPLIYIGIGWYIGLNYARKPLTFGPYPDIPVVAKSSILGRSIEKISGGHIIVTLAPLGPDVKKDNESAYFNIKGYFEVPQSWSFDFPPAYEGTNTPWKKSFLLTGDFSRVSAYELKNLKYDLGYYTIFEFCEFLKKTNRAKEIERLKPYLALSRLESKYPWLYSESVLMSSVMGSIFKDNLIPYDILGLFGIAVLFIALFLRSFWLWIYYLYWVFAYWFGRIGYHDPNLILSKEGWQVILWSFWHRFICNEGRLFLVIALVLSVIVFVILEFMYLIKHSLQERSHHNAKADLASKRSNLWRNDPMIRYWKGQHAKHKLQYHVVLVRRNSKRLLQDQIVYLMKGALYNCCKINHWWIEKINVQSDNVHFLIQIQPNDSIIEVVQILKNATSNIILKQFPDLEEFLWGNSFWQDGYFAETIGQVNEEVIRKYINEQRK